ncbi:autophagy-related protein 22-like protein [Gorgonomyces haynaldii]|nr:autophagy-related protein 22-like protein [Gorgonomyces haynaldii]
MQGNPTKDREIYGFMAYSAAIEGYQSLLLLWPVLIDRLAFQSGKTRSGEQCQVQMDCLVDVNGTSVASGWLIYGAFTVASFGQLIVFLISPMGDQGAHRKQFMMLCSYLSCFVGALGLIVHTPSLIWLSLVLYALSLISLGLSRVFYNAYLPILTLNHDDANTISAYSASIGFISGAVQLVAALLLVQYSNLTVFYNLAIAIACSGGIGFLILFLTTRRWMSERQYPLSGSWTQSHMAAFRNWFKLPEVTRFLFFWLVMSISFNFMHQEHLGLHLILAHAFSAFGCGLWTWIQRQVSLTLKQSLIIQSGFYAAIPVYCLFTKHPEIQISLFGFLYGSIISHSRGQFSELLPIGFECLFNGWFESMRVIGIWIGITLGLHMSSFYVSLVSAGIGFAIVFSLKDKQGKKDAHFVTEQFQQ